MDEQNVENLVRYNIEEINAATEEKTVGNLGKALYLHRGLAEYLLNDQHEPDVFCRRIIKSESEEWKIDYDLSFSIFYINNSIQTTVCRVTKKDDDCVLTDYYQIPYSEIVPRITAIMKGRLGTDERWYVAQTNNIQLEGWLEESGAMCMTTRALRLLDDKQHETIRNEHGSGVEQRQKSTND